MRRFLALALLFFPALAIAAPSANAPLQAVAPAPVASALDDEVTAPTTAEKADEKYAADTAAQRVGDPSMVPKAPELEKLAEREAQWLLWNQQLPATQAQLIDEAKRALEQGRGHASAACATPAAKSASREVDAVQTALKRIRRMPVEERETARLALRSCIDHAAPPPGAPTPRAKPVPETETKSHLSPAQKERCRFRNLFGC